MGIAHGQMHEHELAEVMHQFTDGEIDVLLCTSIIESGLDIPNANTLIVDRGDTFGLAQLYQLRGRVGRGAQRAYAYFFRHRKKAAHAGRPGTPGGDRREYPAGRRLFDCHARPGNARRRRTAGHPPARLHCRGRFSPVYPPAGPGGAPAAPGFRLGCARRVAGPALKEIRLPVNVDLPFHSGIPLDYVPDQNMRLRLYRRLADLQDEAEAAGDCRGICRPLWTAAQDVDNLFYQMRVKMLAEEAGLASVSVEADQMVLRFPPLPEGCPSANLPAIGHHGPRRQKCLLDAHGTG